MPQVYVNMKSVLILFIFPLFEIGVFDDTKKVELVSVMMGDSVTLHTNVTEIQSTDVIEWRFEGTRIATIKSELLKYDEAFRDGMQLDPKTGDLNIINIRTTDYGQYVLKIKTTKGSPSITFNVSVVSVDKIQSVLVGESVTLHTNVPDLKKYDVIQWNFEHQKSLIAEFIIKTRNISTYDGPNGRFKHRLQLDYWTGSLTITNIGTKQSGLYEVEIRGSIYTIHKKFNVALRGEIRNVSGMEGDSVILKPSNTKIQTDDIILWMFGDTVILYQSKNLVLTDVFDGKFRDRLKLDNQTGSLTITNTRITDSGLYNLKISSSGHTLNEKFIVTVNDKRLSSGVTTVIHVLLMAVAVVATVAAVMCYNRLKISKGQKCDVRSESVKVRGKVILKPGVTKTIQEHDVILWGFEGNLIAGMTGNAIQTYDVFDGRFRDSLDQTGSLTITDITTQHAGLYQVSMMIGGNASFRSFKVTVFDNEVSVIKGGDVTLKTDIEIQGPDQVLWKFGDEDYCIAHITGWTKTAPWVNRDKRFRDRLELDDKTGSLTITNITTEQTGLYQLQITRSRKVSSTTFSVTVSDSTASRRNGEETAILLTQQP